MKIIPAILPSSYRAIEDGAEIVHDYVKTIQIDFVDGHFAPNRTWPFNGKNTDVLESILNENEGLPYWDQVDYEFDLMIKDPIDSVDKFVALGPSKIIFHVESLDQEKSLAYFENLPQIVRDTISFGIAIGIDTDPELLRPYISHIDTIQCMGIAKVGYQGHPFDMRVIDQIKKVKALYPEKNISVDGGVSLDNAESLATAGTNSLVVGSVIFHNPDPIGTINRLQEICLSAPQT
jgi:ribulose-phosphate 3-epimerase